MSDSLEVLQTFLAHPASKAIGMGARVYDVWQRHKAHRAVRRIEQVQKHIVARVDKLDERLEQLRSQPEDVELFISTLHSLMEDDESQKVRFYAAFLEYQLTKQTDREQLRLIAAAFRSLTFTELGALAGTTEEGRLPKLHQGDWLETMLLPRLTLFGLYIDPQRGVYGSRFTSLGLLARLIALNAKNVAE